MPTPLPDTETLDGYVVDLICLRKYPAGEYAERARAHTRACALDGHCIESGFGLVSADGRVALLDPSATPLVVDAVRGSEREAGIRLRVRREERDGAIKTVDVEEETP
jgi:hypothetical protein